MYEYESLAALTALNKLYLPACICEAFSLANDAKLSRMWSSHGVVTEPKKKKKRTKRFLPLTQQLGIAEFTVLILSSCPFSPKANKSP